MTNSPHQRDRCVRLKTAPAGPSHFEYPTIPGETLVLRPGDVLLGAVGGLSTINSGGIFTSSCAYPLKVALTSN